MAIVRNPIETESPVSYVATLAFFCCVSCVVLMMRFRGFRASLNFGSKKNNIDKDEEHELAPESSISGSYRTNRDELYGNGSLPDGPKKLTPSMVVLPLSSEDALKPMRPMRPTKSTSDLMPAPQPPPQQQHKSVHNVSHDPRGPSTSQPANTAPAPPQQQPKKDEKKNARNQKDAKNQKGAKNQKSVKNQDAKNQKPWNLKEAEILQKKLEDQIEKRRLIQMKEKEKEQVRREKVKREKEKKEAQERAKAEKTNRKKKPSQQQPAANPLAHPQAPGLTRPKPGPAPAAPAKESGPAPGPSSRQPGPPPPPQPSTSYSTNTLESSISRSSGPPPYAAEIVKDGGNSNASNVTFGKSIDKPTDSWDLVSQHRQQLGRPVSTGMPKAPPKSKVMDLQYKLGNDDSNSEV